MRVRIIFILLVFLLLCVRASAADAFPRVGQYTLDVSFVPVESRMAGHAVIRFVTGVDLPAEAVFYLHGELSVDSLTVDGRPAELKQDQVFYAFDYSLIATEVHFPTAGYDPERGVDVYYSGYFHPSKARSPSDYMRVDKGGVYLRSYGYSLWFPTFLPARHDEYNVDFPAVTIRTPAPFRAVFVGSKVDEFMDDTLRVTHWQADGVSLFDAQLTAQRYEVVSQGNVHLYHYVDPLSTAATQELLDFTGDITSRFQKHYRRSAEAGECYVIEMPQYGDIASGNVTGLTYSLWQNFTSDENMKRGLAHELVHAYVRVPVARADPLWSLAIEGFPSYFHIPVLAEMLGDEFYDGYMERIQESYLNKRETGRTRWGPLPKEKPFLEIGADEMSTYKDTFVLSDRALLFLDYLYREMGRETFFTFTGDLFNRENLTAVSFRKLIEKHLPGSAAAVDLWLATTEYPERFHRAVSGASGR